MYVNLNNYLENKNGPVKNKMKTIAIGLKINLYKSMKHIKPAINKTKDRNYSI